MAATATWIIVGTDRNGNVTETPAHPPAWCVSAVYARGEWPGVRHLEAVVEYPVLRPDGTLLLVPGYDPTTGLQLEPDGPLPDILENPNRSDALRARDELLEVVSDFPFEKLVHRAAWLAALLTPLARFAFSGPAPLFLCDANTRAAGKGLLLDTISTIVTGQQFTIATYTDDIEELRKRITSLCIQGDRMVLFDNLDGKFGNSVLDAALTGTFWEDRQLGCNRTVKAPLNMSWYATGNNVAVQADTARRLCHVRLETEEEKPEERSDFRHPNLLAWVRENRPRLLADALTILRAYCRAGRPDQKLKAWGTYEGWSSLVRGAVVWIGLPDPGDTRLLLQEQSDTSALAMRSLLMGWEQMDPERRGLTAAQVIQSLREPGDPVPDYHALMEDAVLSLVGRLDARSLGNQLRKFKRRVFDQRFLDRAGTSHQAALWVVRPASDFRTRVDLTPQTPQTPAYSPPGGESRESGESFSPRDEEEMRL
jgi:hypothetical protein